MLNLTLKENEGIQLGKVAEVRIVKIKQNKVELGMTAPLGLKIVRLPIKTTDNKEKHRE